MSSATIGPDIESTFSAESYFATQPAPLSLDEDIAKVREFVQRHKQTGRRVVLVTVWRLSYLDSTTLTDENACIEWRNDGSSRAQCVSVSV